MDNPEILAWILLLSSTIAIILLQVNYLNMPKDDFYTKGPKKIKNKTKQCKTKQKRKGMSQTHNSQHIAVIGGH
jgi:hypothetical protein